MSFGVYVGVYLRVAFAPQTVVETVDAVCSANIMHNVENDHRFCPMCGALVTPPREQTTVSEYKPVDPAEFSDATVAWFWTPASAWQAAESDEYVVWLVIDHTAAVSRMYDQYSSIIDRPFDSNAHQQGIDLFRSTYAKQLEVLDAAGITYDICFGVVPYY